MRPFIKEPILAKADGSRTAYLQPELHHFSQKITAFYDQPKKGQTHTYVKSALITPFLQL
jgi:hypothetical protein